MGVWEDVSGYIDAARDRGLGLYGATLSKLQGGIPIAASCLYAASDSGFMRWKTTKPQGKPGNKFREAGFWMATTTEDRRGECERFNFDPFDVESSIWGAARSFEAAASELANALATTGWQPLYQQPVLDQVALTMAVRSAGIGCVRGLLRRARIIRCAPGPLASILAWMRRGGADCSSFCGTQEHAIVLKRISRKATIALRLGELGIGGLPLGLPPSASRPPGLAPCPPNLYDRLDELARAAKRAGDAATGPWPTGVCMG